MSTEESVRPGVPRRHAVWMLLAVGAAVAASAIIGPSLPDSVPVHWGLDGEADRYGSPWELVVLMPATMVGIIGLLLVLPWLGPFRKNMVQFRDAYGQVVALVSLAMLAIHVVILLKAAGWQIQIGSALCVIVGLMLALTGNLFGKLRRNFYVGIRTPWTLANNEVWERTHRLGGRVFVAVGLTASVAGLVLPQWMAFIVLIGGTLAATAWAIVFSVLEYRRGGSVDNLGN